MSFEFDSLTKGIGIVTATFAMIGGGYTMSEKLGVFEKDILTWAPEYFEISDGPVSGEFKAVVARQKNRDDCEVVDFTLEVRDSEYVVHTAVPSIAVFSGPASDTVDKFGYKFTINAPEKVALGAATLLAHIKYNCPEGEVIVNYPAHENLTFTIK